MHPRENCSSLMQSYFTGAVFKPLRQQTQSSFKPAFELPERGSISVGDAGDSSSREHIVDKLDKADDLNSNPDELDSNPRYSVREFHSEILPDDRAVSVYLPPQYLEQKERHFPVLYLQDGQNLFDGRTSYITGKTWNANKTADRLTEAGEIEPLILVGIANTGLRRMAEYTPTRDFKMGGGEGRSYGRLLIEELKPWIDRTYRTLPEAKDTGLGGSSLGGLISLYVGFAHPEVFGKLAVMSPSVGSPQHFECDRAAGDEARSPDLAGYGDGGRGQASAGYGYAGAAAVEARLAERSRPCLRQGAGSDSR
jgi:predicted alpha/beta superfamily hydrolase